jgi:hypothetical protein
MGITFCGYIDNVEEQLVGKRRCLFLCDSAADVASLPTTSQFTLPSGGKTAVPAPGSIAIVGGGGATQFLSNATTPAWGNL